MHDISPLPDFDLSWPVVALALVVAVSFAAGYLTRVAISRHRRRRRS